MAGSKKDIPSRDQLMDYEYAVAGHAGTLRDEKGELFIKPCTQSEIDFYESANRDFPEFADIMPLYLGSLMLTDATEIDEAVDGIISNTANAETTKAQIAATIGQQAAPIKDGVTWVPSKDNKIKTDTAVVLENSTFGFECPNILDVKLGKRLWADDAPAQKKERFDKISASTTHGSLGFRIAGMRVFQEWKDRTNPDDKTYKIYDKDYGRVTVNDENVDDEFRKFIFTESAGIDEDLGQAVCECFLRELKNVKRQLTRHESRMYSTSLLFVFEGDGDTLREAIAYNNSLIDGERTNGQAARTTRRVDSGIALDEDEDIEGEDSDIESSVPLPQIFSLRLIDFAHAKWTPDEGKDKNLLMGVQSLIDIFERLARPTGKKQ